MKLLFSPHSDDQILFAAFTMLREKPLVVTVYACNVQQRRGHPAGAKERAAEDVAACAVLGCEVEFLGIDETNDVPQQHVNVAVRRAVEQHKPDHIYAPMPENGGHLQHNKVGLAAAFAAKELRVELRQYLTYTSRGKSTHGRRVDFEPAWLPLKWRALSCYESQILNPAVGALPHFIGDLTEYWA